MARVTIGMPVYNGSGYLREALDSILAQTFQDFELVIGDNASTDDTEKICREYAARDPRIRYYRHPKNLGAAANFNYVFRECHTEYFRWAAHDDLISPNYLERCIAALDANPEAVIAYTKTAEIDEDGNVVEFRDPDTIGYDSPYRHVRFAARAGRLRPPYPFLRHPHSDVEIIWGLMRSDALRRTPLFCGHSGGDHILVAWMAALGRFAKIPEYLFFNRTHSSKFTLVYLRRRHQVSWWRLADRNAIVFPDWRLAGEFLRIIRQGPFTPWEAVYCYGAMAKYVFWNSPRMARDLLVAARRLAGRLAGDRDKKSRPEIAPARAAGDIS